MRFRHKLWPSLAETKRITKEKREAKKELESLIDENDKNLLLDYSGENNDT